MANIDETFDPTLSERQYGMRGPQFEFTEECDRWDTWKFANERRYTRGVPTSTGHRNENGVDLLRFQVVDHIVDALPMQCAIAAFAGCVDA